MTTCKFARQRLLLSPRQPCFHVYWPVEMLRKMQFVRDATHKYSKHTHKSARTTPSSSPPSLAALRRIHTKWGAASVCPHQSTPLWSPHCSASLLIFYGIIFMMLNDCLQSNWVNSCPFPQPEPAANLRSQVCIHIIHNLQFHILGLGPTQHCTGEMMQTYNRNYCIFKWSGHKA